MYMYMAIDDGLDLDFNDTGGEQNPSIVENDFEIPKNDDIFDENSIINSNPSILDDFLKLKGISDSKVVIVNENNEEEEVDFYSLSKEEQLQILNSTDLDYDYGLEDSEIDFLNDLRSKDMSIQDFLESYKNSILSDSKTEIGPTYEIDDYTDNELYLLDLQTRFDDFSEEELIAELDKELQNPELFKRKVDKLRGEYKQLEDQYNLQKQEEFKANQDAEYSQFVNTLTNVARNIQSIHDIELEDQETNMVLKSLIDLDENGNNAFYKSLNDPNKMYELAWYNLYGKEAFDTLVNAYESKIKELEKQISLKPSQSTVVVKKGNEGGGSQYRNIHNLI